MQIPKKQLVKYVVVGVWNTVFGYFLYAFMTWLLDNYFNISYSYMYSFILSNFLSISQAFVAHKYLVFKTKGNFWREYKKGWMVYGTTALMSLAALPFAVNLCNSLLPASYKWLDKYVGGIIVSGIAAVASFLGHNKITFGR